MKRMYAITHIGHNGRQLTVANQGRNHYHTRALAQAALEAFRDNPEHSLSQVIGEAAAKTLEVRWIQCYDHGDADGIYFDNPHSSHQQAEIDLDLEFALLLKWCTGGNRSGNPYCKPEVIRALEVLAVRHGIQDYLDAADIVLKRKSKF